MTGPDTLTQDNRNNNLDVVGPLSVYSCTGTRGRDPRGIRAVCPGYAVATLIGLRQIQVGLQELHPASYELLQVIVENSHVTVPGECEFSPLCA